MLVRIYTFKIFALMQAVIYNAAKGTNSMFYGNTCEVKINELI